MPNELKGMIAEKLTHLLSHSEENFSSIMPLMSIELTSAPLKVCIVSNMNGTLSYLMEPSEDHFQSQWGHLLQGL